MMMMITTPTSRDCARCQMPVVAVLIYLLLFIILVIVVLIITTCIISIICNDDVDYYD